MTQQDDITQRVLTDDEIRDIITGTHQAFGEFKSGYMLVLGRAIETAVLSKLRAPVADERAAFQKCHSAIIKAIASIARANGPDTRREDDPELIYRSPVMDDVVRIRAALDECSAALASAPVAGEAQPSDAEVLKVYAETVAEYADGRGFEAGTVAFARSLLRRYAAPQASEAVRTQVLAALESAQRFIRNGIEFGYIRMPDADTPDPAHRTPGLIDAAIRSLKSQADKDGGQQRAAFDHPVFAFLLGEGPLHGVHFGERAPGAVGKWWWRKDLRAALSAPQTEQGERDA